MKQLTVQCIKEINYNQSISIASTQLDKLEKHILGFTPWPNYPYKPQVQFAIAHSNKCIFLKYFVDEKFIMAAVGNTNGAVWEDACVEFFVSFDEKEYYNLEFNCIGTCRVGFGKEKKQRELIAREAISKIKYGVFINNQHPDNIHWELTVAIPPEVFTHHNIHSFEGEKYKANFYKCGDGLQDPHFVSWSDIKSPQPDFHLPQFFGDLIFE